MGAAKKTEQSNRAIRSYTRRHLQRLAISAIGRPHADKIDQGQRRFLLLNSHTDTKTKAPFKVLDAELIV